MFGAVHWLEAGALVCVILCGAYHIWARAWLVVASTAIALAMAVLLIAVIVANEWHGWYWARGWWHLLYFPGFSLLYTAVTFYTSVLLRDITIEQGIEELARMTTINVV